MPSHEVSCWPHCHHSRSHELQLFCSHSPQDHCSSSFFGFHWLELEELGVHFDDHILLGDGLLFIASATVPLGSGSNFGAWIFAACSCWCDGLPAFFCSSSSFFFSMASAISAFSCSHGLVRPIPLPLARNPMVWAKGPSRFLPCQEYSWALSAPVSASQYE